MKKNTTAQWIQEAKRLRAAADSAEVELLEFLYQGESRVELWQDTGLDFASFVERAQLCKATRYLAYKRVRDEHGLDVVRSAGVHALVDRGSFAGRRGRRSNRSCIDVAKEIGPWIFCGKAV